MPQDTPGRKSEASLGACYLHTNTITNEAETLQNSAATTRVGRGGLIINTQVTLTLSDELYEHARRWATITQRDLSETLTDALTIVLTPVCTTPRLERPVSSLSNEDVLALSKAQMRPAQGRRLSELLEKQCEALTESERPELLALMHVYEQLWVRQSEALAEAVRRGLRKPLEP